MVGHHEYQVSRKNCNSREGFRSALMNASGDAN
jgi:hypothetical protein